MTDKQIDKIKTKIKNIRSKLAEERRTFGCYDDSRGLRYLPPELYVEIGDFAGGLTYYRWFMKNFPDDCGYAFFWFNLIIILQKINKLKEAEFVILKAYFSNIYTFDKFFGNEIEPTNVSEYDYELNPKYVDNFPYSSTQKEFSEFSLWLKNYLNTDKFKEISEKYRDLCNRIRIEKDNEKRSYLIDAKYQLITQKT